jgi:protein involved in polysaccharide export with SLBB domain
MRRFVPGWLSVGLWLAVAAAPIHAQTSNPSDEQLRRTIAGELGFPVGPETPNAMSLVALSGPIDPATYRLGPGDRLVLQWSGRVTRQEHVEVGPAGDLFVAEIGSMNVAGKTLAATRESIIERLRRVTRDVRVEVQLSRPRVFRVHLSGAVTRSGPVEAIGSSRVSDVLRLDLLAPGASRRNIRVVHRDGSEDRADLERLGRLGDRAQDVTLQDGDAIVVPMAKEFVWVSGAVAQPGRIELAPGDSAGTLLRLAGGPLPAAAPDGVTWLHWSGGAVPETLRTSLADLGNGRGGPLAHEDRVFVAFVPGHREMGQVFVRGEVARPGSYPIKLAETKLSAVIIAAGGFLPSADLRALRIERVHPEPDPTEADLMNKMQMTQRDLSISEYESLQARLASLREDLRVDWIRLTESPATRDVLLRDGDVITVERVHTSIRVDGQVARPGVLTFQPGENLKHYVQQAGGYSDRAWRGHEQVTRAGTQQTILAKNVDALAPGDFIWVPMRPEDSIWRRSSALLSALAQVATVVIAIRSVR